MDDRSSDALLQSSIPKFFPTGLHNTFVGNPSAAAQTLFRHKYKLNILKSVAMLVCVEHDACKTDHRY